MNSINKLMIIGAILILSSGCKEDTAINQVVVKSINGSVQLLSEYGMPVNNMSGIKVTLLENQTVTYTDSSGNFSFRDLAEYNKVNLKYEYSDYPIYIKQDINLTEGVNEVHWATGQRISLSPKSAVKYSISNISPYNDHGYWFDFVGKSKVKTRNYYMLIVLSKKYTNIDYVTSNYFSFSENSMVIAFPDIGVDSIVWYAGKDSVGLRESGFSSGDSLYVRVFPVTSHAWYSDKTTGKYIYPSIGEGSNILGMKLK